MRKSIFGVASLAAAVVLCTSFAGSAVALDANGGDESVIIGIAGLQTAPLTPGLPTFRHGGVGAQTCGDIIYSNTPDINLLIINVDNQWVADDARVTETQREACIVTFRVFNNLAIEMDVDVRLYDGCPAAGGQVIPGSEMTVENLAGGAHEIILFLPADTEIPNVVWPATRVRLDAGHNGEAGWLISGEAEVGFTSNLFSVNESSCSNRFADTYGGFDVVIDGGFFGEVFGACCNDLSGICAENVPEPDCRETGDRWGFEATCADFDPVCGEFNDECANAQVIECGSTTVFDNTQGTQNLQDDPFICSPDGQGQQPEHTLYYKFVATATSATISTCDTDENGASNTIVSMYSSCDVFIDELGCDHDRCDPHASLCADGLTIGDEYIVLVSQVGGTPGSVTLNLDCAPECGVDPVGACCLTIELCVDATEPECRGNNGTWQEGTTCNDDPEPCSCGTGQVLWDNNMIADAFSGRAISPPQFPDIRVEDDFEVPNGVTWTIQDFHFNAIEDAGWQPGNQIEVYVREHNQGGGPVEGAGNELVNVVLSTFVRTATGDAYFGRENFDYCVRFEKDSFQLFGGRYWIGSRNPNGGGSGTNYWMSSDGGPDGGGTDTGWFSLNAGDTFAPAGAGWQHAFTVTGDPGEAQSGACCRADGTCDDGVDGGDCRGQGDRFTADTLCVNLDPPCAEATGGCCLESGGSCTRNPEWICDGDTDGDGQVNPVDSGLVQANFGSTDEADLCQYDVDCDGQINPVDSGIVQSLFGTCNAPRDSCGGGGGTECVEVGPTECADRGGDFLGVGTDCQDDPCGFGTGACCVDDVCVGTTREADCAGDWFAGEDCEAGFECPAGLPCAWDNSMIPNGFSGRAISPPNFPDIRVVDDITVDGCVITTFRANIIEDAGWTSGGNITVYVYDDGGAGGSPGSLFTSQTTTSFTRIATGDDYFGRADFDYTVSGLALDLPAGTYWVGSRNGGGGGAGTNYWMTSDAGVDGGGSSTGYFSLDGGGSFAEEGAGWHHAFELLP